MIFAFMEFEKISFQTLHCEGYLWFLENMIYLLDIVIGFKSRVLFTVNIILEVNLKCSDVKVKLVS